MIRLDDLGLFVRTAALGSFSNAAREADLLPGQASAAVARLEAELGVRLFARSTRSLRLTPEGQSYLPYAREVLAALREGRERLIEDAGSLQGSLRIAAPSDLGRNVLLPWLSDFRRQHPCLDLHLHFSDQVADIFRDPVDVAIRLGTMSDASFVALPLVPGNRRVLVASPSYLERRGAPASLEDLAGHDCLSWMLRGNAYDKWSFPVGDDGQVVQVKPVLVCDDADVVRRLAIEGHGIAYKSWLDVRDDIASGRLTQLLAGQPGEPAPLHFICPHRQQFSPAIRRLHAVLRERFDEIVAIDGPGHY